MTFPALRSFGSLASTATGAFLLLALTVSVAHAEEPPAEEAPPADAPAEGDAAPEEAPAEEAEAPEGDEAKPTPPPAEAAPEEAEPPATESADVVEDTVAPGSAPVDEVTPEPTAEPEPAPEAAPAEEAEGSSTTISTTATTEEVAEEEEEPLPISASLKVETSVGLGTFVSGLQNQSLVTTGFLPSLSYSLGDGLALKAAISGTWYQLVDYGTPYENDKFLWTDLYLQIAHGSIYANEDLGLTISGAFRVYLPTSLSSQFQKRIMSLRPSLGLSWALGPVTLSYSLLFMKYFPQNSNASLACDEFDDPTQCKEGRGPDVDGGFVSEKKGGEVFLPSAGVNSFYVAYSVGADWEIIEDLTLGASVAVYHIFGVRSRPIDEMSSIHAKEGRNQTDRLITSLSLGYAVHKNVSLGFSFDTDTVRPFGDNGNDLVVFDFERAPSNISSLSFSITGKL